MGLKPVAVGLALRVVVLSVGCDDQGSSSYLEGEPTTRWKKTDIQFYTVAAVILSEEKDTYSDRGVRGVHERNSTAVPENQATTALNLPYLP